MNEYGNRPWARSPKRRSNRSGQKSGSEKNGEKPAGALQLAVIRRALATAPPLL